MIYTKQIYVNHDLCVGLLVLVTLNQISDPKVRNNKDFQYIAKALRKKHYNLEFGSLKDRTTNNLKNLHTTKAIWNLHLALVDKVWKDTISKFKTTNYISIAAVVYFLFKRNVSAMNYYGISDKRLNVIYDVTDATNLHTFSSMRSVTRFLDTLKLEIATTNLSLKNGYEQQLNLLMKAS
jgi:hypothetical protein